MHELSVATSLLDVVMEHLIESGAALDFARVRTVAVEVGDLSGVVPAALRSAFKVASDAEPALRGAALEIRPIGVAIYCEHCKTDRPAVSTQALRCAVCDRPSATVVRGRELDVVGIEIEPVEIETEVDDAATHA